MRYDAALPMADTHVFLKHACKEIALGLGQSLTFMAKPNYAWAGSSSHIHQSLWSADGKQPLFFDKSGDHGMSDMMKHYVAGLLAHADEITYFLAPFINSYKRYIAGTFAPTRAVWSFDNRTAGYRLCGADSKAIRIECRVGGSDLNPYLAFAALLAAGLDGIENKMALEPVFAGDAYDKSKKLREIPKTLREATACSMVQNFCARRWATMSLITMFTRRNGNSSNMTGASPTWEVRRGFEHIKICIIAKDHLRKNHDHSKPQFQLSHGA